MDNLMTYTAPKTAEAKLTDGLGFLFGYPIAHSMAPLVHNTVFEEVGLRWKFTLFESTDMTRFLQMIRDPRCYGAAVTMPHKVAVLRHLDELTEEGHDVGACNTIVIRTDPKTGKRRYVGTNTDVVGIRDAFYQNISDPDMAFHGRPGLVVGGGGAARSAVYAMQRLMRCSPIYMINRDKSEVDAVVAECQSKGFGRELVHVETLHQAQQLEGPGAIVSCVPDFAPKTDQEKLARSLLVLMLAKPHKGAILEMCYHPNPWTQIAELAQQAGWRLILGTEAMIYQGLEQDRLWSGKTMAELPVEKVRTTIAAKLRQPHL